jgi:hypothetical protein
VPEDSPTITLPNGATLDRNSINKIFFDEQGKIKGVFMYSDTYSDPLYRNKRVVIFSNSGKVLLAVSEQELMQLNDHSQASSTTTEISILSSYCELQIQISETFKNTPNKMEAISNALEDYFLAIRNSKTTSLQQGNPSKPGQSLGYLNMLWHIGTIQLKQLTTTPYHWFDEKLDFLTKSSLYLLKEKTNQLKNKNFLAPTLSSIHFDEWPTEFEPDSIKLIKNATNLLKKDLSGITAPENDKNDYLKILDKIEKRLTSLPLRERLYATEKLHKKYSELKQKNSEITEIIFQLDFIEQTTHGSFGEQLIDFLTTDLKDTPRSSRDILNLRGNWKRWNKINQQEAFSFQDSILQNKITTIKNKLDILAKTILLDEKAETDLSIFLRAQIFISLNVFDCLEAFEEIVTLIGSKSILTEDLKKITEKIKTDVEKNPDMKISELTDKYDTLLISARKRQEAQTMTVESYAHKLDSKITSTYFQYRNLDSSKAYAKKILENQLNRSFLRHYSSQGGGVDQTTSKNALAYTQKNSPESFIESNNYYLRTILDFFEKYQNLNLFAKRNVAILSGDSWDVKVATYVFNQSLKKNLLSQSASFHELTNQKTSKNAVPEVVYLNRKATSQEKKWLLSEIIVNLPPPMTLVFAGHGGSMYLQISKHESISLSAFELADILQKRSLKYKEEFKKTENADIVLIHSCYSMNYLNQVHRHLDSYGSTYRGILVASNKENQLSYPFDYYSFEIPKTFSDLLKYSSLFNMHEFSFLFLEPQLEKEID